MKPPPLISRRSWVRSVIRAALAFTLAWVVCVAGRAEENDPEIGKVPRKLTSKNGKVIVELRGDSWGFPTSAWFVSPSTGKKTELSIESETYIADAAISDDGMCLVLQYHVSSGGHAEAFVREKGGTFQHLFESHDADEWISSGKVVGLSEKDIPRSRRNLFHDISLVSSPNRFVIGLGNGELRLTYSPDQRRVVGWDRLFFEGRYPAAITLWQSSGNRGFSLIASGDNEPLAKDTMLVSFPFMRIDRRASEIRLRRGASDRETVVLTAKVNESETATEAEIWDDEAVWDVELSGRGKEFDALVAKLSRVRGKKASPAERADWREVTKFSVIWKAPEGRSIARNPQKIIRPPDRAEPVDPASAARAVLQDKVKEAIEKGDYHEAGKLQEQSRAKDPASSPRESR